MGRSEPYRDDKPRHQARADGPLQLMELSRGEPWPERSCCEIVLLLECGARGLALAAGAAPLSTGETALLPLGNRVTASAHVRVLSARLEALPAPKAPQRIADRLIAQLLRRAWASSLTAAEVIEPTLRLVERLVAANLRAHQARLDLLDRLDPRIARVIDYVDAHHGEALTVAGLADVAGLSPGHFSRAFKSAMGEPVWAHVQRLRRERAKGLLRGTDLPLAEIAYRCGFASQAHMTTACRRAFGATPGAIRAGG